MCFFPRKKNLTSKGALPQLLQPPKSYTPPQPSKSWSACPPQTQQRSSPHTQLATCIPTENAIDYWSTADILVYSRALISQRRDDNKKVEDHFIGLERFSYESLMEARRKQTKSEFLNRFYSLLLFVGKEVVAYTKDEVVGEGRLWILSWNDIWVGGRQLSITREEIKNGNFVVTEKYRMPYEYTLQSEFPGGSFQNFKAVFLSQQEQPVNPKEHQDGHQTPWINPFILI